VREAVPVEGEDPRVTVDDVAEANTATLSATAKIARNVGTLLLILAAVGTVGWLWVVARQQGLFGGRDSAGFFISPDGDLSLTRRVDLFASSLGMALNFAFLAGMGLALRLGSDYVVSRTGGSLTDLEVGEPWPDLAEDESDDEEDR
jgi:hypothetical protein